MAGFSSFIPRETYLHPMPSIDDTARLGAIAMKESGYEPSHNTTIADVDVDQLLTNSHGQGNGSVQDANNALALYAMGLQAEFEQASADRAMEFNAGQAKLNRDWQTSANQKAMDFSAEQAQLNRDWQERMSNTAYQRSMNDLKKAGLNPILAYANGGAATTSGATASGFSSSGSSASGYTADSSMANFDFSTTRDLSIEEIRYQKDLQLKKIDSLVDLGTTLSSGLLNIAASIARGGNVYNFAK